MALLEVRGLVKFYGSRKVVDGVSFDVNPGEVVGLLGPNGAGKTTSFRMTTGQLAPNAGEVIFDGNDVSRLPMYKRARRGMGYLSQEQSVFRRLSVEQNVLAILEALPYSRSLRRRLTRRERRERTDEVLTRFQLTHIRKNPAGRASGGEKRRLEIARALVCEPLLILLDEPFAAVDPKTKEGIRANIRELADAGIGILLTDHDVREVLKITDRSYLIKDGQVVTKGSPQELIRDPIAIDAYLGTTFNDDGFHPGEPLPATVPMAQAPAAQAAGMNEVLEQEQLFRWVAQLASPTEAQKAATGLITKGTASVPALMVALERRDLALRQRALDVLNYILSEKVAFDPAAPEEVRKRQILAIRRGWEKKAG